MILPDLMIIWNGKEVGMCFILFKKYNCCIAMDY
jgi:hypothetical protein